MYYIAVKPYFFNFFFILLLLGTLLLYLKTLITKSNCLLALANTSITYSEFTVVFNRSSDIIELI